MTSICQSLELSIGDVVSIVGAGGKTSLLFRLASELRQIFDQGKVLTTTTTKMMLPAADQCPDTMLAATAEELIRRATTEFNTCRHLWAASHLLATHPQKAVGFPADTIDQLARSDCFQWILVEADGAAHRHLKAPEAHEPVVAEVSTVVIAVVGMAAVGRPLESKWVFRPRHYAAITRIKMGETVTASSVARAALHPLGLFKNSPDHARRILFLNTYGIPEHAQKAATICRSLKDSKTKTIQDIIIGGPKETDGVIEHHQLVG
jgi:probable selenium-dependent hydroxylase accessory protein YqeC